MTLSASQQNNAIAATEFLHPLSDAQLFEVLEALFADRPVNPDALEQFANRLGRIAHMKAREYVRPTGDENPETQSQPSLLINTF